jgi:hypothetical protein
MDLHVLQVANFGKLRVRLQRSAAGPVRRSPVHAPFPVAIGRVVAGSRPRHNAKLTFRSGATKVEEC